MNRKKLWIAGLISFALLSLNFRLALAHETITVGDYEIEVGWLNEPPIVGEKNGIVVNVTDTSGGGQQPVEDVSSLTVFISYGGQRKVLMLQPLGEDTPGQFVAPILPTVPGEYEVIFSGSLGETAVDAETHVEEVQPIETLAFPSVDSAQQAAGTQWLVWLSILIGLIGVGIAVTALRKASMR
jgi:hypothetical protein